jgi:PUA domain protein
MCPGLTSKGGALPATELPAGAPVAVFAEGKEHAIAVGTLAMGTAEIRAVNKGIGIEVLHYAGDDLWKAKDRW